jgi:hypothetical protein
MFPVNNGLKQGKDLSLLLSNLALYYPPMKVRVNQYSLKLNGTHHFLVYAHDVNILEGSVHKEKMYNL